MLSLQNKLSKIFVSFLICLQLLFLPGCHVPATKEQPPTSKEQFPEQVEADFPTGLVFTDDKLFFTEKGGKLKMLEAGAEKPTTLLSVDVPELIGYNELGLLGIALSPSFKSDKQIYLYHSYQKDAQFFNRVVRIEAGKPQKKPVVIVDGINGGSIHNGGKLAFGPDANLYIATGESGNGLLAQNKNSLNGKVLRIKPDGSLPPGNPFNNKTWSYGHRNIFGMAFDNKGNLFVTENGPESNDEVNQITKGANYGWPETTGFSSKFKQPLIVYEQSIAPTGIIFYTGNKYKDLTNKLVFTDYLNGDVHRLTLKGNRAQDKIIAENLQAINAIAQTKDGIIYIATENRITGLTIKR